MSRFLSTLVVVAAITVSAGSRAFALPAIEGIVRPLEGYAADVPLADAAVAWRGEVRLDPESSFFRLHFVGIEVAGEADFAIVIRNEANRVLARIPRSDFAARGEFWTTYLFGNYALVELVPGTGAAATRVAFTIAEAGIETQGARVLNVQDPNDPKDRPLYRFGDNAALMSAARPVAKLRFTRNGILYSCTGFLVADDLLLTNQHCMESIAECTTAVAQFGFLEDADRNIDPGEEFPCDRIEDSDAGLDFALLRLKGSPGTKWGRLQWRTAAMAGNAPLYVIQHPNGRPKRIARDGCILKTLSAVGNVPGRETDVGHTCDTENGSSGSPVLDDGFRVVALHHLGFDHADRRWVRENRAVKASILADRIAPFIDKPR